MGLEMSPGSVISQLDAMNESLNQIISNGEGALSAVYGMKNTEDRLKGESYDKVRDYYSTLHMAVIRGIILFAEAYIEENNTYKSCIFGHLSGIGYVNEDALKEARERVEAQIQNARVMISVSKDFYLRLISSLEDTLFQINKKLEQIENFVNATQGLYQNLDSNKADVKRAIGYLNQSSLDGIDIQYYCDDVTRVWINGIIKSWAERTLEAKEPFVENMQVQFGFDRETAEIFFKLYVLMDAKGMENINQEYFAMIASVCYPYDESFLKDPKNYLWHFLAGTDSEEAVMDKMMSYGLEAGEVNILVEAIKCNHDYSQFLKRDELQEGVRENYLEYFAESNMNEEEQDRFIQDEAEKNKKYLGKADIGHMSITLSTILKPNETPYEHVGDGSGIFNGLFDLNANAGYVGDVYGTAGNGPRLTPDDYKADLDSVNLSERLKNGGNAVIAMERYYTGIADGTVNRAEEFAKNLGNGSFEAGIEILREEKEKNAGYNNVLQAVQDAGQGMVKISELEKLAVRDEWITEKEKISNNFIRSVEEKRNEYMEYEKVDVNFAEKGTKSEKNQD